MPVAGVGYRARGCGPRRCRRCTGRPVSPPGRTLVGARGDHGPGGLDRAAATTCSPGGWAFEFANDNYPDIDDTAEVVLALRRTDEPDDGAVARACSLDRGHAVPGRGLGGVRRRQHPCALPRAALLRFRRAHRSAERRRHRARRRDAVDARARAAAATERGVAWLLEAQEPDGSWFGRWGANHLYGTGAVVPALIAAGVPSGHAAVRRAVAWVESPIRTTTGDGARTSAPTRRRLPGSRDVQCQPDRLGPPRPAGGGRTWSGRRRGRGLPRRDPAGRRDVGRDVVHRHRLPGGLLHQLPPLPPGLPGDGARSVRRGGGTVADSRRR